MSVQRVDYLIIGAGIMGLAAARELRARKPHSRILVIEKEASVAEHASGRNSGVLHGGFYYSADSFKARFTVAGNHALRAFCREKGLRLNSCGKLVVAATEEEREQLHELEARGRMNGSTVEIISERTARKIEPNVRTVKEALWSPLTATVEPGEVCRALHAELAEQGVMFRFSSPYLGCEGGSIRTPQGVWEAEKTINCGGVYADRIARDFGYGTKYTIIPFKGLYLQYQKNRDDVRTNIYPVPNLKNPFLGVHFTKAVDGTITIGPTAIPALWREHYRGLTGFRCGECAEILGWELSLFLTNAFNFRVLALEELANYFRWHLISSAAKLVQQIDPDGFGGYGRPGIRAQLLRKDTRELVQDFVIEGDTRSVHLLNAVSPAFTCSLAFAEYLVADHVLRG